MRESPLKGTNEAHVGRRVKPAFEDFVALFKAYRYEHTYETMVMDLSSRSQPKARFSTRLDEQNFLNLAVWEGKTDPTAEVIVLQLRRRTGDEWETVGRLAVYRSSDGIYSKLPERRREETA